MKFDDWEDEEQQRQGSAFDFEEGGDSLDPLLPHASTAGLVEDVRGFIPIIPTGPLSFIESTWFRMSIAGVILANVVTLVVKLLSPGSLEDFEWLNSLFLSIYCSEILLRIAHFQDRFFYGTPETIWNWTDFAIVVSGVLDEWVLKRYMNVGNQSASAFFFLRLLQPFRILFRAVRFLRILRLLRVLLVTDLLWVESDWFRSLVGLMIVLNAVIMGLETDVKSPVWFYVEQVMLTFFVLELTWRIRMRKAKFFTDSDDRCWNVLDLLIVLCGVFDQWVLEVWDAIFDGASHNNSNIGQMMMLARMLRLMRILRLVRVVKAIRPLRQLAIGVIRAMQSMFWVLVLTFVCLYSLAILTTRMIGWGQICDDPDELPQDSREMFDSMEDSMFTLFAFMNGHEWHKVRPLLDMLPWAKPMFVAFTICGSWALLSVMTGVVSDHIQVVRQEQQREDDEAREERREQLTMTLSQIFASADKEGSGYLSRDAFMDTFHSKYQVRRLERAIDQPLSDVRRIFDWLDVEGREEISFREFCEGLDCLQEPVTGHRLLKMDSGIKLQCSALQKLVDATATDLHDLSTTLKVQHVELMRRIEEMLLTVDVPASTMDPLPSAASDTTPASAPPTPPTLRYARSVSSLKSNLSTDSMSLRGLRPGGIRMSKSVSFSDVGPEIAEVEKQ